MLTRTLPLSLSNMFSPDHKCEMKRTMAVIVKNGFGIDGRDGKKSENY